MNIRLCLAMNDDNGYCQRCKIMNKEKVCGLGSLCRNGDLCPYFETENAK